MSSITDGYTTKWCAEHPGRASALIAQYEQAWADCAQCCAKIQAERDHVTAELEKCQRNNSYLRGQLSRVTTDNALLQEERERDTAQHIASLVLDVEGWLFRTVDALTDEPSESDERTQSALLDVYNDMQNARENRRKGRCLGPGKCQDPGCPAHYAHGD